MAKESNIQKEKAKKAPEKTLKEKRAAKKAKSKDKKSSAL